MPQLLISGDSQHLARLNVRNAVQTPDSPSGRRLGNIVAPVGVSPVEQARRRMSCRATHRLSSASQFGHHLLHCPQLSTTGEPDSSAYGFFSARGAAAIFMLFGPYPCSCNTAPVPGDSLMQDQRRRCVLGIAPGTAKVVARIVRLNEG